MKKVKKPRTIYYHIKTGNIPKDKVVIEEKIVKRIKIKM